MQAGGRPWLPHDCPTEPSCMSTCLSASPSVCACLISFHPVRICLPFFSTHTDLRFPWFHGWRCMAGVHVSLSCCDGRRISLQLQCLFCCPKERTLKSTAHIRKREERQNQSDVIECSDAERNQQQSQQPPLLRTPAE